MKLIIVGGRDFDRGDMVIEHIKPFKLITEIVCGMCRGADMMGYNYATLWDIPVTKFPADWDKYGKSAGYIRNKQMAKYADAALIFWDGKSKGTKHMIDLANEYKLITIIVRY